MTRQPTFQTDFASLAPHYDVIFSDIWGVLHNGLVAAPAASDALMRFRARGGLVVLITNAPRPGPSVIRQLDKLGVPRRAFDGIVTSGDLTRKAVAERRGQTLCHLGPERDVTIFDGLDAPQGAIESADYVVCSGLRDDRVETVEDYRDELDRMRARGLPMICANPDLVVERGHELVPCAGALALAYEALGGEVYYAGKPHRPVYEEAQAIATRLAGRPVAPERVLAIGDAIRTDIAGAVGYGIDALFLARGIHAQDLALEAKGLSAEAVLPWLMRQEARPTHFAETLLWRPDEAA